MCTGGSSLDSLLFRETFARKLKAFLESAMVSFTQIGTAFLRTGIKGLTSGSELQLSFLALSHHRKCASCPMCHFPGLHRSVFLLVEFDRSC